MKFSLIVCTLGRIEPLRQFLNSLLVQTYSSFEVILVDQNEHDQIEELLQHYKSLETQRLHSSPGLSRARNIGIQQASGDIITFPDDDCEYLPETLQIVAQLFQSREADALVGRWQDRNGVCDSVDFDLEEGQVTLWNAAQRVASTCLFVRRSILEAVGNFDEEMGVGARWGSSEDVDYVLRMIEAGVRVLYLPELYVLHPSGRGVDVSPQGLERLEYYALGTGRLWRKHYPFWYAPYRIVKALGGLAIHHIKSDQVEFARRYAILRGSLRGWLGKPE